MKKSFLIIFSFVTYLTIGQNKNNSASDKQIEEIKIVKTKKAIEHKADRTIFDFASQSHLNSGTVMEGLKKIPGLISSDVAGIMYQGKLLDVYLDSRPLNISSNELTSFLEGMPANSVEKIEIITQPGAEFPATSGGAILNIITSKNAKKYLSATYTNSSNFTNYNDFRLRTNNSILLNARNKYFAWQFNVGQNYRETAQWNKVENKSTTTTLLSNTLADRYIRGNYAKTALTFDFKKDRMILNYDVNYNNNTSYTSGEGFNFNSDDLSNTKYFRQSAAWTYQKRFNDKNKKLDFLFNYTNNHSDFNFRSRLNNLALLDNTSNQDYYNFKIDFSQPIKILDEGKVSVGTLYDELHFNTKSQNITNLNYSRRTAATYLEFQAKWNKFDFIVGGRTEDYLIKGNTNTTPLIPFNQFKFFPNVSLQYNFMPQIFLNMNYNKKIALPSTSALNPNNTTYQNQNVSYAGNPNLQPTIYDNYEVKISAFDYAYIGYNVSIANNQVVNRITENNNSMLNTSINVSQIKIHNFNIGLPLPYMLFTKGLAETMKFDFNPDKINFLFIYAGYQVQELPDFETNGFWIFNFMSQIILPKDIKFVTNYSYLTSGGNNYYFYIEKPLNHSLDFSFSKKFLNEQLTISLYADDVLNTNKGVFSSIGTPVYLENKSDTRRFGFSLNYKLPTKNKLVKEDPNLLNKDKKEDNN